MTDQESETPKLNFDRLAGLYRWMEWLSFGPYLDRCRRAFLPELADARRALVLGDGDGRFTAALLKRNAAVCVDAIDVSEAMLESLKFRAGAGAVRVRTQARDVRVWTPREEAEYDLIVTHFFLDCLTADDVRRLAERLRANLQPGVRWVISEFAIPHNAFGRWVARPVVSFLYWAFRVLTGLQVERLPDWQSALQAAGFQRATERRFLRGLLTSQLWVLPQSPNQDLATGVRL
ncbi:class I SAM-dependent methyltransferase [Occallatibacter riparius]|uniref:Class I SAM-dependent methyltransferase n=1 Tax=Occallatibacter riparius TaxID=1002689 RepID=A0A9J7BVH3_9BACT|nr:class I SAM-dependent methyltransferase [Occallatibacter riparius]UWZ86687.1 class I SAM-dependent methyltransferase [Occallatibacter riparius]